MAGVAGGTAAGCSSVMAAGFERVTSGGSAAAELAAEALRAAAESLMPPMLSTDACASSAADDADRSADADRSSGSAGQQES
jgi:hypothetical protein